MAEYTYEQLKEAARKARAEMARVGRHVEKRVRTKPRDPEKLALLRQRAMDRLKRYPPVMTGKALVLPYFRDKI
ncbi:MAG: hypothetical protein D6778_09730 [Nitrospirae bacterium]|nr:MAG: hypothetical protein D6778_09730 [Nitrospirota bacterium]